MTVSPKVETADTTALAGPGAESARPASNLDLRAVRKNIFLWALIGFILPTVPLLILRHWFGEAGTTFTISRQLPIRILTALGMIAATCIVARRERRPLAAYGLSASEIFGARFWEGAVWGFAMLSAIPMMLLALGEFHFNGYAISGTAIVRDGLGWGIIFLGVAFSEELAFRSYLLVVATRRIGFWKAALAVSFGFAIAHLGNGGENALGIFQVFVTGMLLCFTFRRTGSLWFALGFHAAWDWAQTFFFGTPDSGLVGAGHLLNSSVSGSHWITGGSAGPEGSLLAFAVLGATALLIHVRFSKVRFPAE